MTSACDTCPVPGNCCRKMMLNGGGMMDWCDTVEEAEAAMAELNDKGFLTRPDRTSYVERGDYPIPMRPLVKLDVDTPKPYWIWWCPNLHPKTGRCMDYENRPDLCREYQPGDDRLCVLYVEPEPHADAQTDAHLRLDAGQPDHS